MSETNNSNIEVKRTKVKMMFLPAIVLGTSLYYSFSFTTGIVIGYILCRIYCNIFLHNGKVDRIFVDFGKWKMHLHHWIMGVGVLAIVWVIDYFYLPTFLAGAICGVIMQDFYDYNDWYKVFSRNPAHEPGK